MARQNIKRNSLQKLCKRKQGRSKLLYPEYIAKLINNEVQPTIDKLRKIAVERTEWSKFVVACKPRLFSAE